MFKHLVPNWTYISLHSINQEWMIIIIMKTQTHYLDYHTLNLFGLDTNVKIKTIFKINIANFLIFYVVIDFNKKHHNFFGWILKRLWTCNGLLKWQHYVCHTKKMKNVDSKKCQSDVKIGIYIHIMKWRIY
jgi:hypothetical protein